jgi:type II secretion system protein G
MSRSVKSWTVVALLLFAGTLYCFYWLQSHGAVYKTSQFRMELDRHAKVTADIQHINSQLTLYRSMNGFYPTTEQGLLALVTEPTTSPRPNKSYRFYSALPKDPWGTNYIYFYPGRLRRDRYDLYSAGPDQIPNTADDDWGESL